MFDAQVFCDCTCAVIIVDLSPVAVAVAVAVAVSTAAFLMRLFEEPDCSRGGSGCFFLCGMFSSSPRWADDVSLHLM